MPAPRTLFKFARREHANAMVFAGVFKIGTLHDFRNQERHAIGIADPTEGTRKTTEMANRLETADNQSSLSKRLVKLDDAVSYTLNNVGLFLEEDALDCFVFCAAESPEQCCRTTSDYDAVVEIARPIEFAQSLARAAGFPHGMLGECNYTGRQEAVENQTATPAEFLKPPEFAPQREWRFLFASPPSRTLSPFLLSAPGAREFCRLVPMK